MNILKNLMYMARRFKTATALNLLGLSVALAAFYLLMTQVGHQLGYNQSLKDAHRLYRLEWVPNAAGDWGAWACRPLLGTITEIPQVEEMQVMEAWPKEVNLMKDGAKMTFHYLIASGNTLAFYGAQPVDGEITWNDDAGDLHFVVLPASVARAYFGTEQVAGRRVCMGKDSVVVRGVYRDLQENTILGNPVISPLGNENIHNFSEWGYVGVIRVQEGVDAAALDSLLIPGVRRGLIDILKRMGRVYTPQEGDGNLLRGISVRVCPLSETYFSGTDKQRDKGNRSLMGVLQLAAWMLIFIAAINFLNFTLAESPMRIRGINTRRVLGEDVGRVRAGLIGEAVVVALTAFVLALLLIWCVTDPARDSELLLGNISLAEHPLLVAGLFLLSAVIGVVAGAYPAWFATSFAPALALKGNFGLTPAGQRLRHLLLGVQLTASILMVCYIGILMLQSRHIFTSDYGFNKDEVLYTNLRSEDQMRKKPVLLKELRRLAGVRSVTSSQYALGSQDQYMGWGRRDQEHIINFDCFFVDPDYFEVMDIRLKEGHPSTVNDTMGLVINPAARQLWPWVKMDEPVLKDDFIVLGVCDDVQFSSMRHDIKGRPFVFVVVSPEMMMKYWGEDRKPVLNIRCKAGVDKRELRRQIEEIVHRVTQSSEPEVRFLDQRLEQLYRDEFRFVRQVLIFSIVCLVITLIGVFCLTMFETEYRRKEIGIRKVFGSTSEEILRMLCRRYLWLLAISFVVAAPAAWYIGTLWLQNFSERTPVCWWLFPLALLVVGTVTLSTVVFQSWRAANANPVESITEG